jgi:type IV secretion system protein VirD4
MLDEFPALGRLDFFESALAFMAGYGLKSFLIAQSLNQIEKAYGPNNAILDNCHVRVSFATNDERPPSACRRRSAPRPRCAR